MRGLNAGSGQRRFDPNCGWINLDINPKWEPEVVANWNNLRMFDDNTFDYVVSHHSLEHVGCGEGVGFIREAHRILRVDGSLLIFVPDMKALAQRWLEGTLSDQVYMTNVYGAYMGDEADRHKWGFTWKTLSEEMLSSSDWTFIYPFDWSKSIPGADIAKDWWIIGMEAVK